MVIADDEEEEEEEGKGSVWRKPCLANDSRPEEAMKPPVGRAESERIKRRWSSAGAWAVKGVMLAQEACGIIRLRTYHGEE